MDSIGYKVRSSVLCNTRNRNLIAEYVVILRGRPLRTSTNLTHFQENLKHGARRYQIVFFGGWVPRPLGEGISPVIFVAVSFIFTQTKLYVLKRRECRGLEKDA